MVYETMNSEIFFMIANILFIAASVPNISRALKDRNVLKGFSFSGAVLQVLGMTVMMAGYYAMTSNINILLGVPNYIYWALIVWYNR